MLGVWVSFAPSPLRRLVTSSFMALKMLRRFLLAAIFLAFALPALSQSALEFKNIESFLHSLSNAEIRDSAQGDLFGRTRMDWVGIVVSKGDQDNEEIVEIYILEKLESGNYRLFEKSAPRLASGGTGKFGYEAISIKNKSVSIEFSYHWHECAGNSTSQFKWTKTGWQLVGIESFETNAVNGSGIEINSSTNFLTGKAIIKKTDNGKSKISRIKVEPKAILFKHYSGEGTISRHEKKPIC